MTQKQKTEINRLKLASIETSKLGIVFVLIYSATTLIYKLWKLMTPDILQERWVAALIMLSISASLWWFSRQKTLSSLYYRVIIGLQIMMYICIAGYSIYAERGMASNSVILFAIPLVIVALNHSGKALLATTLACGATYAYAAIRYFREYPSEGYKVELYGGLVFYISILFLLSALLWVLVIPRRRNR